MWWRQFKTVESLKFIEPMPGDHPDPRLAPGVEVRLVGRPERIRRVICSKWHSHRRQFVYVVETSAPSNFEPYWFAGQLAIAEQCDPPKSPVDSEIKS